MGTGYGYIVQTMELFLGGVQNYLLGCNPPYTFTFDRAFVLTTLPMKLVECLSAIDTRTH